MNKKIFFINFILLLIILVIELFSKSNASLLIIFVYYSAIFHGIVAFLCSLNLIEAKWHLSFKNYMLKSYNLLLIPIFLFFINIDNISIYKFLDNHTLWYNKYCFVFRNLFFLILIYIVGKKSCIASLNNLKNKNLLSVIYLLVFVITHSLFAFDMVMPLIEHHWVSTLLGGYFFIESFFLGMVFCASFIYLLIRKNKSDNINLLKKAQYDINTLIFGFSLVWAGLFYAQYLTIWYGNIYEETSFFIKRFDSNVSVLFCFSVPLFVFILPFILLLFKKIKQSRILSIIIYKIIFIGIFIERIIFIAYEVNLNIYSFIAELIIISLILYSFVHYSLSSKETYPD